MSDNQSDSLQGAMKRLHKIYCDQKEDCINFYENLHK